MWVYILILIIILVIIAIATLLYIRKIKNDDINQQLAELEKVKSLPFDEKLNRLREFNLHGELQSLIKNWQHDWETSLNEQIQIAENNLNQSKEDIEQFKFKESSEHKAIAQRSLSTIETKYKKISDEVDKLYESNAQSEKDYELALTLHRECKREVLANGHKFGDAKRPLEQLIQSYEPELKAYQKNINDGNYVTANQQIYDTQDELQTLKENMEDIPVLIKEVQKDLPQQFQEIKFGCRDLKAQGYDLNHLSVENKLSTLKANLNLVEPLIASLELDEARKILSNINDEIDDMLELIELEVKAKTKVEESKSYITDRLFNAKNLNYTLRTEIDYFKEYYYINESDVHSVHKFENEIENLIDLYDDIVSETSKTTTRYSEVLDNTEYLKENIQDIYEDQETIQSHLVNLREDEEEARENSLLIKERKETIHRKLMNSNLTSVPERFIVMKNELDIDSEEIEKYFKRRPIHVQHLKDKVNKTVVNLNKYEHEVYEVLHEAQLTEMLIQYGNRYRREDPEFNKMLLESERLFRENRYRRALEIVKSALEKVEPGAANRIENEFKQK